MSDSQGSTSVNRPRGLWAKVSLSFPDDPKVIEAGYCAELAYLRCTLLSRQHLTDGVIHRARAARWLVGIPGDAADHMGTLVRVGLMEACDDGWRIPESVWRAWNPTADELEKQSETKRAAAKAGNHVRYHVNTGRVDASCPLCLADSSQTPRTLRASSSHDGRTMVAEASPDTETETEPEKTTTTRVGGGVHAKQVAHGAASMLMQHEEWVERPGAWKAAVADRLLNTYDIPALVAEHGEGAACHLYELERPRTAPAPSNPYAPRPPEHDPNCEHCAGSGWRTIDFDRNVVGECTCAPPLATVTELRPA